MAGNFEFVRDLYGNRIPKIVKLPVATTQTLVIGDLVEFSSQQIAKSSGSIANVVGIMAEPSASQTAGTLVEVALIAPGFLYKATADADASSNVRDGTKLYDINSSTQTIDIADSSNGCIILWEIRADDDGTNTSVNVLFSEFATTT